MLILPSKTIISFMESREKRIFLFLRLISFPGGSDGKESACNVGDLGSIPGSRRSPGEGNGNPLQYSCLENTVDQGFCIEDRRSRSLAGYSQWDCKESDMTE